MSCKSCYAVKTYCRSHKTWHCGCAWNSLYDCLMAKKKPAKKVRATQHTTKA